MNLEDYPIIEDEKGNNEENEEVMVDEVKIFEICEVKIFEVCKLNHNIKTIENITNHEVIKKMMDNKKEMTEKTMYDENEMIKKTMGDKNEIIKTTKVIETTMNKEMDEFIHPMSVTTDETIK